MSNFPGVGDVSFRKLAELLPAGLYTCEAPSGRITFYNAQAARLWGREPQLDDINERFCGSCKLWRSNGLRLRHDETPMAQALLEGRATRNEEVVIERPDGSRVTVLVNIDPILDSMDRIIGAINVFHDTTDIKLAWEARAHLAAIVESSDDAIISKNLNGIITSWNAGAERLFGYSRSEAIGQSVTMLIPADRHDEEPGIIERVRRGERIEHYETIRRSKGGTLLDISLTVSPIRDVYGRVIGASKIARDITERKEIAKRLEVLREEAESANRSKDEFLAMLGHELRNPLSSIRNAVVAATLDGTNRVRALNIARRAADQLTRLVDDLLDVARVTQGRVLLHKERLSLAAVVQRNVDGVQALMEERGHSLTLSLPSEELFVEADPTRIEQAITNLLMNAAKYTDRGGTIAVTVERDERRAVVRVRDNGIGIAPEILPRVFDLFTQAECSLDRAQGGLGIGLALVRRIVELHGGTVEVKSPGLGGGSEFAIRLPASPTGDLPGRAVEELPKAAAHPARVLMVEDSPDVAESLVLVLELLGHHVRVVQDGPASLAAARANIPDIMLVDIGLPGMNGYELAKAIRADAQLKRLVLVALTGYGGAEDKAQAMAAGFDYHLVKPVDVDTLGSLVSRIGSDKVASGPATQDVRH